VSSKFWLKISEQKSWLEELHFISAVFYEQRKCSKHHAEKHPFLSESTEKTFQHQIYTGGSNHRGKLTSSPISLNMNGRHQEHTKTHNMKSELVYKPTLQFCIVSNIFGCPWSSLTGAKRCLTRCQILTHCAIHLCEPTKATNFHKLIFYTLPIHL